MKNDVSTLIIVVALIFLSAIFSALETAFWELSRSKIKTLAGEGNKKAKSVLKMTEKEDYVISSILVGNSIVNILATVLTSIFVFNKVQGIGVAILISAAVSLLLILIFGEIIPKTIGAESPEKTAMLLLPVLKVFMVILAPVSLIAIGVKKLVSLAFKKEDGRAVAEEELLTIVEEAEEEGEINEQESNLIKSAIEFSEQEAIDVLTPRIDIEGVSEDATKEEIAKVFAETGYSRLPIYRENIDHITGILYLKDFHNKVYNTDLSVESIVRPAIYTTQTKKISELLKELQVKKLHIAVVLDEYGATMGIVTLEDILEELVGEIWDEHDEVTEEIVTSKENEYIVLGSTNIEEMFEELDIKAEEEFEVQTVSGWVMEQLGQIPKEGDFFETDRLSVTVTQMDEKRVEKIKVVVLSQEEEE